MPRLQIPIFEGDKPRWWIRQCERFFHHYQVAENQKVNLAVAYLNDIADAWFQAWSQMRNVCRWQEFEKNLCEQFGEQSMVDVVEEFNKLKQEGSIIEYQVSLRN